MRELMTQVLKDILGDVDKDIIDEKILKFKKEMKTQIYKTLHYQLVLESYQSLKTSTPKDFVFTNMKKGTPVHVKARLCI